MRKPEWFEIWFDTPYYKLLYRNRDESEAERFLDVLLGYLKLPPNASVLDVACGTGRYSMFLADRGFNAIGIDLSYKNIEHASVYERENLTFFRHDMREIFYVNYFDAVFNFYTSFGYFSAEKDHLKAIRSMSLSLKKGGKLIIDFFNSSKTVNEILEHEDIARDGILFSVKRTIEQNAIVKKIYFQDEGKEFHFEERVQMLTLDDFNRWFGMHGLKLKDVFGDYKLNPFDEKISDRMIVIAEKI
ncbi:MAG: class I SAM-dependent methyltransferase [Chitinophagales bacterium]